MTLIANVKPRSATGTVQFKDGDTAIGNPAAVINGTALTITPPLTTGMHSLTAVFTPTETAQFGGSTSPPVPLSVTPVTPVTPVRPSVISHLQLFIRFLWLILGGLHL